MTPNYLNLSQNASFLVGSSMIGDHDIDQQFQHQFFSPSFQHHQHDANSSSSSHHSFNFYFNPTQDQVGCNSYHTGLVNRPQQQFDQDNGIGFGGSYDCYQVENKVEKGLKITLGSKKEGKQEILGDQEASNINDGKKNCGKWMSSKARIMKKSDHKKGGEREDTQKLAFNNNNYSLGSNNDIDESNGSSYNTPIRVCTDCNTTKTPLWRSGPKGPKSLCNACGIRQRKARRALAAAAANATLPLSSTETSTPSPTTTPTTTTTTTKLKIKVNHQKEKPKNNYGINENSTVPFKKRCRLTTSNASLAVGSSSSSDQEPAPGNRFEGFLINLRNQLALDHVFPSDEKEAAILLMALSCGLPQ